MSEIDTQESFLTTYNPKEYPSIAYTVDMVVLTIRNGKLSVLLVKRGNWPFKDQYALPGGFVDPEETSEQAAARELEEETRIQLNQGYVEQLKTYSTPHRDPRMRVISTAYVAFIPDLPAPEAGDDAKEAHFFAVDDLKLTKNDIIANEELIPLAFDHATILQDAIDRVSSKLEYTPLAAAFLDENFTITELRRVYEAVWGFPLHTSNFRRKVLNTEGFVIPTGTTGKSNLNSRTAELYRQGAAQILYPAIIQGRSR